MAAIQPYLSILQIDTDNLTKSEIVYLEAELFLLIGSLLPKLTNNHINNFQSLQVNLIKENTMLESNLMRQLINDILSSETYDIRGIAYYTDTPEDVIHDVVMGNNQNPSLLLTRRLIDLHRSVRPEIYRAIADKIKSNFTECIPI